MLISFLHVLLCVVTNRILNTNNLKLSDIIGYLVKLESGLTAQGAPNLLGYRGLQRLFLLRIISYVLQSY